VHSIDPAPGQIGQRREVCLLGQHLSFEAPHLAGGGCILRYRPATHDPTHGWITPQPVSIVDVLVSGEPPEDRLSDLGS
jgi:hypothetical protein